MRAWMILMTLGAASLTACEPPSSTPITYHVDASEFRPSDAGEGTSRRPKFEFPYMEPEESARLRTALIKLSACGLPITFNRELEAMFFVDRALERQIILETTQSIGENRTVVNFYPLLNADEALPCVEAAGRCDEALACVGVVEQNPCDPQVFEDYCSEGKAVHCARLVQRAAGQADEDYFLYAVRDCAQQIDGNTTCHTDASRLDRPVDCVYESTTCDETYPRCDGDTLLSCDQGRVTKRDCARMGGICDVDRCRYGPEHACAEYDGEIRRCHSGQLTVCPDIEAAYSTSGRDRGDFSGLRDCGAEGFSCDGADDCAYDPPECDGLDNQCDESLALFCVKGRAYHINCASVGARCDANGADLRCVLK